MEEVQGLRRNAHKKLESLPIHPQHREVMSRKDKLLSMAADAFADGRNPFEHDSLVRHNVTLDECMDLSEDIAAILRGYLASSKDIQMKVRVAYAFAGSGLNPQDAIDALRMAEITKKLTESNTDTHGY